MIFKHILTKKAWNEAMNRGVRYGGESTLPDQCPESYKQYYCDVCGQSTPTAYSRCQECVEAGKTPSSKLADWQDRKDGTVF